MITLNSAQLRSNSVVASILWTEGRLWRAFLGPLQDRDACFSGCSACCLLRSCPGTSLSGKTLPSPRSWPLPHDSPPLRQCSGRKTKARASRPNLGQPDGSPQPQSSLWKQLCSCYDDIAVHLPPSPARLCFSESPAVFILDAFASKPPAYKSLLASVSPGELNLWHLFFYQRCLSPILLSLIPEHYHGFLGVSEIQCLIIHLHHHSFQMLRFSQVWPVGASSSWLLCSFHMSPLVLIFEHALAF